MKKIFILTGEPSGDKLASTVISRLKLKNSEINMFLKLFKNRGFDTHGRHHELGREKLCIFV